MVQIMPGLKLQKSPCCLCQFSHADEEIIDVRQTSRPLIYFVFEILHSMEAVSSFAVARLHNLILLEN